MRVYLIRHTTPDIDPAVCYGRSDVGLADSFELESRKIIEKVGAEFDCANVYTSPLNRCSKLANALTRRVTITDDRLLELDFGAWERTPWNKIDRRELDQWMDDFVVRMPPGGESLRMMYDRTESFISHLLTQTHDTAAIVTHAGVIRCFWAYIVGIPLENLFRIGVEYGDVFEVELTIDIRHARIRRI